MFAVTLMLQFVGWSEVEKVFLNGMAETSDLLVHGRACF
jgi:hypothetical protein